VEHFHGQIYCIDSQRSVSSADVRSKNMLDDKNAGEPVLYHNCSSEML